MATRRPTAGATRARDALIALLKDDHRRVKKAYRDFRQRAGLEATAEGGDPLVTQVLDELTVHATLEEELLYPAVRAAATDTAQVDEAEVEHETVKTLVGQLRGMVPGDAKYAARFTVLCEYTLHHIKEEEGGMFPRLTRAKLDWPQLLEAMTARRAELVGDVTADAEDAEEGPVESGPTGPGGEAGVAERPSVSERSDRTSAPLARR